MHSILKFHSRKVDCKAKESERRQERYLNWKGIEMKMPSNQRSDTPRAWPIFSFLRFCQIWSPSLATPDWNAAHSELKRGAKTITRLTFYIFVWSHKSSFFYYFSLRVCFLVSMRNEIIKNWNLFATLLCQQVTEGW